MNLDTLVPFIAVDVPGCPDPTIKQQLVLAAGDFCQQTLCWDEIQDPVPLLAGIRDYDIDAPTDASPLVVRDVWIGSRKLQPKTMWELQQIIPNWITAQSNDPLYYNSAFSREQLSVYPIPDGTGTEQMVMRVAYAPKTFAESLPDFLDLYLDAIVSGTKARLMASPGTTYSRPDLVTYHQAIFDNSVAVAKAESMHERVPGLVTVRPRSFI